MSSACHFVLCLFLDGNYSLHSLNVWGSNYITNLGANSKTINIQEWRGDKLWAYVAVWLVENFPNFAAGQLHFRVDSLWNLNCTKKASQTTMSILPICWQLPQCNIFWFFIGTIIFLFEKELHQQRITIHSELSGRIASHTFQLEFVWSLRDKYQFICSVNRNLRCCSAEREGKEIRRPENQPYQNYRNFIDLSWKLNCCSGKRTGPWKSKCKRQLTVYSVFF